MVDPDAYDFLFGKMFMLPQPGKELCYNIVGRRLHENIIGNGLSFGNLRK